MNEKKEGTIIKNLKGLALLCIFAMIIYYFVNENKESIVGFIKESNSIKCPSIKAQIFNNLKFEDKIYLSGKASCELNDYYFDKEDKRVSCNLLKEKEINYPSSKELDRQCYTKAKYGNIFSRLSNEKFDKDYLDENLPELDLETPENLIPEVRFVVDYTFGIDIPIELIQRITNEVLELIAEENEELRDEINIKLTSNSKLSDEVLNLESMISGINTKNTSTSLTRDEISNLINQLKNCWTPPAGVEIKKGDQIKVQAEYDKSGKVINSKVRVIDSNFSRYDENYKLIEERAINTFFHPDCEYPNLPLEKYDAWKKITFTFDYSLMPK